eukprot:CAMPEP_0113892318 /NCGR_PEP_ID=MMETSP0780_2-20120614/15339_1 /TAXON_ID=652834 /ORGANISM="Palpitomonas bilix" /LENGTH=657 /DNA_ID=CAMNT_0000882221 /DNA_START=110 /DNA_END=2083 /DNA_ORIENTATION=+ /assembly_acc=CAM_ASM_000599
MPFDPKATEFKPRFNANAAAFMPRQVANRPRPQQPVPQQGGGRVVDLSQPQTQAQPAPLPVARPARVLDASAPAPAARPARVLDASAPAPAARPARVLDASAPAPAARPARVLDASAPAPASRPAKVLDASAPQVEKAVEEKVADLKIEEKADSWESHLDSPVEKKEDKQPEKVEEKKVEEEKVEEKKAEEKKEETAKPSEAPKAAGAKDEDDEEDFEDDLDEPEGPMKKSTNIVFIGHVDAGKSTISGHIMYLTGMVDERTMEKFEREAKAKNRESWKYAWAMDLTDTERAKGKTEECGKAVFETDTRRYTILDAPGHKSFVPHMIGGAAQADVGVLVISARRGEFETGFEKGGQTREHAVLAKTAGVRTLIVAINKMDDPTVEWSKDRYDECISKLTPFLKSVGFNPKMDVIWLPMSGLTGANIKEPVPKDVCSWQESKPLLTILDELKPPQRLLDGPVRLPVQDKYKALGTVITGKLESGTLKVGDSLMMMPNKHTVEVLSLHIESHAVTVAEPGDNLRVKLKGVEEEDIRQGFVLSSIKSPISAVTEFEAELMILEHKSIICAGYGAVLHIHGLVEEVVLEEFVALIDRKTKKRSKRPPPFVKPGQKVVAKMRVEQPICLECYKDFQQLGRFMIRDEGRTVGVGIVTQLSHSE